MEHLQLEQYKWDAENCCGCKGCVWVDPIYASGLNYAVRCPSLFRYKFDAYSALGRLKLALGLLEGSLNITPTAVDIIYRCNLCGACDVGCKRNLDLDPLMVLETLRIRAVDQGAGPLPSHAEVAKKILHHHNRYGRDKGEKRAWLLEGSRVSKKADILYFVGCNSSYKNTQIARDTLAILDHLGISYTLLEQESCCGHPLYYAGMASAALDQAKQNLAKVEDVGARIVLTSCAECYKTWKVDYPKLLNKKTQEMGYRVMHTVELLAEMLSKGNLIFPNPVNMRVTYHDPCNLGRMSEDWIPWNGTRSTWGITKPPKHYRRGTQGIYRQPRDLLLALPGIELMELPRARENALCCGAGGGVMEAYPDFALFTARHRLQEAADMDVEAIVSACPYCLDSFRSASPTLNRPIKVYDIVHLLAVSLTGKELDS
ncbi:MAG: hypothetical protein JRH08_02105 [Deltaproteobacteria bacterium]|nr:hypothetical protein [Deltaproteobacteria bacterium]MBW1928311.1 hypothetical protein [Deltaproteobacteria bacterium]MBW2026844.1 hypothetical protein [Deltaproteobacteria bacterium]MBW2124491.1 hypothetical protein [Deltaproteobacteria bacterium]RLB24245.1 MAG: hypothetical protein DRG76_01915 [Deltaproteobacteria bacterium]